MQPACDRHAACIENTAREAVSNRDDNIDRDPSCRLMGSRMRLYAKNDKSSRLHYVMMKLKWRDGMDIRQKSLAQALVIAMLMASSLEAQAAESWIGPYIGMQVGYGEADLELEADNVTSSCQWLELPGFR